MKTKGTLRAVAIGCIVSSAYASVVDAQEASFTYGHIFVLLTEAGRCIPSVDVIVEIDPLTGEWSVLANSQDGLCESSGLRFTPDGRRLLALNGTSADGSSGSVLAFQANGIGEIILDGSDGLEGPSGVNGLAFDAAGNLYVLEPFKIMRFPGGGGPGEVFADEDDGTFGFGGLGFGPDGDLFLADTSTGTVLRFTPSGDATVFDVLPEASSLVFDRAGNLFVTTFDAIYRYDKTDASTRRLLVDGFTGYTPLPITISADGRTIYAVDQNHTLYEVDPVDGTVTVITELPELSFLYPSLPFGIAINAPASIPAVSMWGALWMSLLLIVAGTLVIGRRRLKVATPVGLTP